MHLPKWSNIQAVLTADVVFYSALLLLVALTSFGLGRWSLLTGQSARQPAAVSWTPPPAAADLPSISPSLPQNTNVNISTTPTSDDETATTQTYVASKNSNKYHLPDCPGAKQIAEQNRITFASKEEAESSGYTPAANCKGI